MEYNDIPAVAEVKTEKGKVADKKKVGLLERILQTSTKFIKDDIKDEDFLK